MIDRHIAIHEAGHAILAHLCDATIDEVDVIHVPDKAQLGHVKFRIKKDEMRSLVIALGGGLAEQLARGGSGPAFDGTCNQDLQSAKRNVTQLRGSAPAKLESCREFQLAKAVARRLLCQHWGAVLAVAGWLQEHKKASRQFIHAVMAVHRTEEKET